MENNDTAIASQSIPLAQNIVSDMFLKMTRDVEYTPLPNGWFYVCFSLLNRFNDAIGIYVKIEDGKVLFSDDGEATDIFILNGKGLHDVEVYARTHGVNLVGHELQLEAPMELASEAMANFLSCVVALEC